MIKLLVLTLLFFASETNAQQVYNKLNVKELDVTSRVNVTSTTKSSKPCPAMTETQRNAIATPLNGSCIYNTTTLKLNVYNGTVWKAAGGGVDNWLTATAYSIDDIVIESSKIYQCLIAHTSGTFATDLAASRWVEISSTVPVNLTGPITSVGNATSIASQTGTGSTFVVQNTPTLTTPNIGAATGTSLTITDKLISAYQTPSNLLNNGDIELTDITPITCTTGTCTRTTTSGEFSQGTAALKVVPAANVLDASWIATTPLGIQKQGFARVIYKVPSTCSTTFVVRTMVDGATQTEVPTSKLIMDNTFRSIEVPLTFGSTSAGIKVYANGTCTGDTFFDGAILSQGLGFQNLQLDNVYSAQVTTTTGVIANQTLGKELLLTCTAANPTVCTFAVGRFTQAPICTTGINASASAIPFFSSPVTATGFSLGTNSDTGSGLANVPVMIHCQKSGNDYLASSANVYSQASGNYDWTSYTPTTPNSSFAATPTGITVASNECKHKRDGGDLLVMCKFVSGVVAASEAQISLPPGLTSADTSVLPTIKIVGNYYKNNSNVNTFATVLIEPSKTYFTFSGLIVSNAVSPLTKANASSIGTNGEIESFSARIPISGWTNSSAIVGSFENVPTVPSIVKPVLFGAKVTTTSGAVANNKGGVITTCTAANPTVCTLVGLANEPICPLSSITTGINFARITAISSSSISIQTTNTSTGVDTASVPVEVFCLGER